MRTQRFVLAVLFTLLAQLGLAFAQNPLVGEFLETQIGFMVTFQQDAAGQLTGAIHGASGAMPLTIQADTQNVQGSFLLEGMNHGFAAQLQPDGQTLLIWLYSLDASGQPIQSSYEQYTALRQQATPLPPVLPAQPEPAPVGPVIGSMKPGVETPLPPPIGSPADTASQSIVGSWEGTVVLEGLTLVAAATYSEDGTFLEEVYVEGQPAGWYAGTWVLGADGTLQQTSTGKSEQICIQGQCVPNEAEAVSVSTVAWLDANTFTLTDVPAPGETPTTVTMQRVTGP